VLSVLLIAPLGIAMGMPFPVGLDGWNAGTRRRCGGPGRSMPPQRAWLGGRAGMFHLSGPGADPDRGGLFYLAALAVVAASARRPADPEPGIKRVVLAN